MVKIPVLRWGQPYESLELDKVVHFVTGETLAQVGQANPGLLTRDMKKAQRARDVLREIPIRQLVAIMKKAGEFYKDATIPLGASNQPPPACPNTCARPTWPKTISCSRTWSASSTA